MSIFVEKIEGQPGSNIKERVDKVISENFTQDLSHYHLSKLGAALDPDTKNAIDKLGGLKRFLEVNFKNYKLQAVDAAGLAYAIVRDGVAVVPPTKKFFFQRKLWNAFAYPDAPQKRFINTRTLEVGNAAQDVASDNDVVLEIPDALQVNSKVPGQKDAIYDHVLTWLKSNNLNPEDFVVSNAKGRDKIGQTILDLVIQALDKDQAKRLHLSLDIVQSLMRRP